ncbi:MAG: glycosyltransferase family 2 protein [Gammaproteobacteria bacterium]
MTFNPCALIPVFNHHREMSRLIATLRNAGLSVIVVDDGSDQTTAEVLNALASDLAGVMLLRHSHNRGKGAAFLTGLEAAARAHYTHALQIDADGQHDPAQAATLLALAEAKPAALISGTPHYDESVPAIRYYGRWITHLLVWLETGSRVLTDSMCGYRVYPVTTTLEAFRTQPVGRRMDFDTEIMVRLHLAGTPVCFTPVTVRYPVDGISNFRLLRDNLRMTWLHLRLLAGLPWRLLQRR